MKLPHPIRIAALMTAVLILGLPATSPAQLVDDEVANISPRGEDDPNLVKGDEEDEFSRRGGDNFKSPKAADRAKRRQEALKQRLAGKKSGKVHEVAKGQYVELELERNDRVFVLLVEYGNNKRVGAPATEITGPAHNAIPQPNRAVDNNTIWQADYNRAHYVDMYFNRMVDYYRSQSSGRYTINGDVTEWVKVRFNGSRYGNNGLGDAAAWTLIADGINTWTKAQLDAGKTIDEVKDYLRTFDVWDRYDYDGDGNFDEPDGYIDHFQIVHSGAGEETGGGTLGADAIWSHRWQVWYNFAGFTGPAYNKDGGVEFGGGWGSNPTGDVFGSGNAHVLGFTTANVAAANVQNAYPSTPTGIWVGDYTIQPENGGLGVFAHEYGHDLGLPDLYDTNGGSNGTGFWTLMSSGSYLGDGTEDIGSRPGDLGGWEKIQLGWSNYEVATHGKFSTHKLGPAEANTKAAQAVIIPLPVEKNVFYLFNPAVGALQYGSKAWWGGKGDLVDNTMTRTLAVPAGTPVLQMRLNYQIENNWDYAYVSVSTNGGTTWTNLAGTYLSGTSQLALTTTSNPNGTNLGNGITGSSTATATAPNGWRLASFSMTPYAGQTVLLRLRYKTDEFVNLKGIMADEITLGGAPIDNAENGDNGWTLAGFKATTGIEQSNAPHYYVAEFRQYRDYDRGLQTGPYTFGFVSSGNLVAHYPYQDGLLVTYWDDGESNNNTSQHPGEGLALPIDAHPTPITRLGIQEPGTNLFWNFSPFSATFQTFDATFSLEATDAVTWPFRGSLPPVAGPPPLPARVVQFSFNVPSRPGNPVFNDVQDFWSPVTAAAGVIVPKTGTSIRIVSTSAHDSFMHVHVGPSN